MDILDDMGVTKLSAKVVLKVNYSNLNYLVNLNVMIVWTQCTEATTILS